MLLADDKQLSPIQKSGTCFGNPTPDHTKGAHIMSEEENKATIRSWVEEAWNKGNMAIADNMYTATYVLHDASGPIDGPTGLAQFIAMFRMAFPDLHMTIEDQITEGDKVAWRFTVRGTHHGEFMGISPTGKPVTVTGTVISRFVDGKWQEDWSNFDALGMLQQLGVIPSMGERSS
jgi:steroid delta-isomerase-like uncharacterized protein